MNEEQFKLAQWLAEQASALDDNKAILPDPLRHQAVCCSRDMHALATEIAGDRVNEIYGQDEEQS